MKQCPRCHRTYTDDTLSFCLQDGAALKSGYDPNATQLSPSQLSYSEPAPTLFAGSPLPPPPPVAAKPAQPVVAASAYSQPPAPRKRSVLAVGAMVFVALAVGLVIGGFMVQRYSAASSDTPQQQQDPQPVVTTSNVPSPVPPKPSPSPAITPSPMATPAQSIVQSTPQPETQCVLYNDKTDKSMVRVRANCDTQDCDNDEGTITGEYASGTPVQVIKGSGIRGERFTWVKVIIKESGERVWVASSKVKCE